MGGSMRRIFTWVGTVILVFVIGLSGCTDQQLPTEPDDGGGISGPFFSYEPAPGFDVLRRTAPLAASVSRTRVIGRKGGKIKLEDAGFVLVIPKGALTGKTRITVTAPAGDAVAFTFEPHGLRFRKPATIRLSARGTTAESVVRGLSGADDDHEQGDGRPGLSAFLGVYFVGDTAGGVDPIELLETTLHKDKILIEIWHFSGYAVAGG
jgi:hypothetical protein